jgi:lysozyme
MRTSPAGRTFIGRHEGLRLTAYRDAAGVWTIGYGHTAAAGPPAPSAGMTITAAEADAILGRDLARFEAAVTRLVTVPLSQPRFDALVSFAFNVGEGALARSTLLKKLNAGDVRGAAAEFGRWNKAGGRVLAGLTRRRAEERAMFEHGAYAGDAGPKPAEGAAAPTVDGSAAAPPSPGSILTVPRVPTASGQQSVPSAETDSAVPSAAGVALASAPGEGGGGRDAPADETGAAGVAISDGKPALASKAVWGGLIAVAAALLPVVGPALGLDAAGQGHVLETLAALGGVVGGLVAIWGRFAARVPIR